MSKITIKKHFAASYKFALDDLRASKIRDDMQRDQLIKILTLTAYDNISCSDEIVNVIRDQMKVVSTQSQILIIALVFSIVSSVGMEYQRLFNKYIIEIFMAAFERADPNGRMQLYKLRDKWDFYFSKKVLYELDCIARNVDRNWPIIPERPERIRINADNLAMLAEIQRMDEEKRILLAEIETLERNVMEDSRKEIEKSKIIKQNPRKRGRRHQIAEFKSKWNNGYQPSLPSDVKIDFSMDSQEDPFSTIFAPAEKKFCKSTQQISGIITPPPENDKVDKSMGDHNSFWIKSKSFMTEKSTSLFFGNCSEFVV